MMTDLLQGDCLEVLRTLPDCSVQCVVTSPPYYGLRDYGTASWEGGDAECDHIAPPIGGWQTQVANGTYAGEFKRGGNMDYHYKNVCKKCGAIRTDNQIGLEATPEAYVEKLVAVFREVRRVLKDDGTVWLVIGDSYNGSGKGPTGHNGIYNQTLRQGFDSVRSDIPGLKPKDLLGIPWLMAFALRADGWWLRQDIIWAKPNPMPESVTDRCTKSHEYIFLLTKRASYYYDAEAVAEPSTEWSIDSGWREQRVMASGGALSGGTGNGTGNHHTRNRRSVWTVTTKPYSGAHFATFPPDLIEPCILAGSRVGDTVLDPFNGSGTTGQVAIKWHRSYIGIELNPEYIELTRRRLAAVQVVLI